MVAVIGNDGDGDGGVVAMMIIITITIFILRLALSHLKTVRRYLCVMEKWRSWCSCSLLLETKFLFSSYLCFCDPIGNKIMYDNLETCVQGLLP